MNTTEKEHQSDSEAPAPNNQAPVEENGQGEERPLLLQAKNRMSSLWSLIKKNKNGNNENDVGFRDDFTEVDTFKLPAWSGNTLLILTMAFIIIIVWACMAKIDKIVKAPGKLVSTGQEVVIRPLVDSIVKKVDVKMGTVVRKGQNILTLDPTFAQADLGQVKIKIENARAIIYRTECELENTPYEMPSEDTYGIFSLQENIFQQRKASFQSKIQAFDSQVMAVKEASNSAQAQLLELEKQIEIADQIRKMRQKVYAAGYDTRLNVLEAENAYSQYKGQAETLRKTISSSVLQIQQLESERNVFVNEWKKDLTTEMARCRSELDMYMEQFSKAQRISQLVDMTAPQDCVVLEIGRISVGSVAKTGEALVTLVPINEPVEVEAQISPQDVGFIRAGDPCKIKVAAFPFQKHGGLAGTLRSISEDTVMDPSRQNQHPYYVGRISLESTKLKNVPEDTRLLPGMSLAAEIVVGERTVISYLLYPMISIFDESIREP